MTQLSPDLAQLHPDLTQLTRISRRNLEVVCKNEYFVTEKTDGVRYLLYVVNGENSKPSAVFYNRFEFACLKDRLIVTN